MSSRNVRLSPEQRADAPRIHRSLLEAAAGGDRASMQARAREGIASPLNRIDYLELVDAETLQPNPEPGRPALLATAVFYGGVRLIDNQLVDAAGA